MQARSWMTALTLALGTLTPAVTFSLSAARAQDAAAKTDEPAEGPDAEKDQSPAQSVQIDLRIAGLGAAGCDVEIKPGHAGVTFKTVNEHIKHRDNNLFVIKDLRVKSADRYCSFTITVREPGQPERVERRGMRLASTPPKGKPQTVQCYLNAPSRIAKVESEATTTKR